jgi:peroxiredoxin Q/BCP
MAEAKKLEVGSKAPDFTLVNHDGTKVKLSSFKGKKVIVYFFPAALTPGCTK